MSDGQGIFTRLCTARSAINFLSRRITSRNGDLLPVEELRDILKCIELKKIDEELEVRAWYCGSATWLILDEEHESELHYLASMALCVAIAEERQNYPTFVHEVKNG